MNEINFFGETNFRNVSRKFGIKVDDRRRHFYAIGKTGMGKTEMLKNMAVQDILEGRGLGFVDPHGEAVEEILNFVPEERVQDVIYFNPADIKYPIAFNVMEQVDPEKRHMVASGLMSVFKKIWPDVWSARMEYILNNVVLALLEYPESTLLGINRMLSDTDYRQMVVEKVADPVVKAFWLQEYSRYTQRYEVEATAAIQNKVGQFISNPLIRNIIGQTHSSIDMRKVMDGEKILLANIAKGRIGEDNSRLLGGLLITKLQLAAMSRVDIPEAERKDFFLYIDEFQHFATESFVNILSEARKYRLSLILSHQYVGQLGVGVDATVRDAVFGNVGTLVTFRIGAEDAEIFEKEFSPEFVNQDFVNMGKYTIYVKLMIDGVSSRPFSAHTLPPPKPQDEPRTQEIIDASREKYATPVKIVEDKIAKWTGVEEMANTPVPPAPGEEQILYDAKCSNCGKDTKVVFAPDGKRPTYCKACRKKLNRAASPQTDKPAESQPKADNQAGPPQSSEAGLGGETKPPAPPAGGTEKVSLQKVLGEKPVLFHPQKKQEREVEKPKRKETNREDLKQVLQQALQSNKKEKSGVLRPGQTVYFEG